MKFAFLSPFLGPFLRQKKASNPAIAEAASPLQPSAKVSIVLKDVLAEEPASEPLAAPRRNEFGPPPMPDGLNVGAGLAEAKRRAIEAADRLIELADADTARAISSLAGQLDEQTCCVAFVGQIKAGKSSLINALVEQLDFLPADINPCTTVITRLNFGVPGKPQSGGLFTFFSREEWRRFSMGGRTRELTERLFPDFDWHVFNRQVREMEERARKKYGASLDNLLGKQHFYDEIRVDSLVRYVGAEHFHAESDAERAEGEFSDITKSADIFLGLGAFSFPTVVIDTPGVNDPFLVRDEITRQNLEAADVCVVVVTARQPLSTTDINLLRTLRGLKKDRLIIFINKIDELNGGEEVLYEIRQQVAATLSHEFPSSRIRVIFGSAAFAHKALSRNVSGPATYCEPDPFTQDWEAALLQLPSEEEITEIVEAEASFAKSGILPLSKAISDMIGSSQNAHMIAEATGLIETVSYNLIAWLKIKADLLQRVSCDARQAEKELRSIAGLRRELAAKFDAFSAKLDAVIALKVNFVRQKLASTVEALIPSALKFCADGDISGRAGQIDVKLRMLLETVFQDAIEEVRHSLANEQEVLKLELSGLLASSGLNGKPAIILGQRLAFSPSLAALSEPAALGYAALLTKLAGTAAHGQSGGVDLPALIIADFAPIVDKLTNEASRVFREGVSAFTSQARDLTFGPMDMVIRDIRLAHEDVQALQHKDHETGIRSIREKVSHLKLILEAR